MMRDQTQKEHGITVSRRRSPADLLKDPGPYTSVLRDAVEKAKDVSASDIHIEPGEHGVDIRLRTHGELTLYTRVSIEHRESLILEAKRIFGLAIGVSGRPQDGRVSLPHLALDLRVNLLPTLFGEKLVLRLLDLSVDFNLRSLALSKSEVSVLERACEFENGVVIISGPTGSGKTRTLYSVLQAIGPKRFNIVTLEDPVEYRIEGLNQVQVGPRIGFADALRAVLRQDPDVILVGEIRDTETARLCFQASETGHLVFSTLHANGAMEVIERLRGLGIDEINLRSNLRLSIAQRLEQKLCDTCAEPLATELTPRFAALSNVPLTQARHLRTRASSGCDRCHHLGITGRIPILEWARFQGDNPKLEQTLSSVRLHLASQGLIDAKGVLNAM